MTDLIFGASDIKVMVTVIYHKGPAKTFSKRITTARKGIFKEQIAKQLFNEYSKTNKNIKQIWIR